MLISMSDFNSLMFGKYFERADINTELIGAYIKGGVTDGEV